MRNKKVKIAIVSIILIVTATTQMKSNIENNQKVADKNINSDNSYAYTAPIKADNYEQLLLEGQQEDNQSHIVSDSQVAVSVEQTNLDNKSDVDGIQIGTQIWAKSNLDKSTFNNGEAIPQASNYDEWVIAEKKHTPAWCYYDNDPNNGKLFGKLYNWYAVNDSRGLAPKGWHIPSDIEWTVLSNYLGGEDEAGKKMKSNNQDYPTKWAYQGSGTNAYNFDALPAGFCGYRYINGTRAGNAIYLGLGEYSYWWSSTLSSTGNAWHRVLYYDAKYLLKSNYHLNSSGMSVRCIKN